MPGTGYLGEILPDVWADDPLGAQRQAFARADDPVPDRAERLGARLRGP